MIHSQKILFIGWGENGQKCLAALCNTGIKNMHVIVPKGYETPEIRALGKDHNTRVEIIDPRDQQKIMRRVQSLKPDLVIVASYPKLLPKEVLSFPRLGAINVHTALLPKYRGYHPINWAIIKDEPVVGVSIHYLAAGMDNGDILAQQTLVLKNSDTINSVKHKLTTMGAQLLGRTVKKILAKNKRIEGKKQIERDASFAPKRSPEEGKIDWSANTRDIFNLVRALHTPYPNAFSFRKSGEKIMFEKSYLTSTPGEVLGKVKGYYLISTGDGVILLKSNQKLEVGEALQ